MSGPVQDSWEDSEEPAKPAPAKLNTNAFEFKPNIGATEFVPSWLAAPAEPTPPPLAQPPPAGPAKVIELGAKPAPAAEAAPAAAAEPAKPPVTDAAVAQVAAQVAEVEVEEEPEPEEPEEEETGKEHLNIVFIGHVDAGKSTLGGRILFETGMVDSRSIEKFQKEAAEKNRESWFLAYILDSNEEERAKGKTVEVGRAYFETETKTYQILDAPGHKNFVPNMIGGCQQADVGVLVISARKGEFETGFERGGQTQEHAVLAKTLGVKKLVLAINKMDDPTVEWAQSRFDEIQGKLGPFLKKLGYVMNKDMVWCPLSAYTGENVKEDVKSDAAKWVEGVSLINTLDKLDPLERGGKSGYFRMPVIDKFKDMGSLIIMGKIESGLCKKGTKLMMYPNKHKVEVTQVAIDEAVVERGRTGDNVKLQLKGIDEEDLAAGHVLCDRSNPVKVTSAFDCQLQILELLEHKNIFTVGYSCILHVHSEVQECNVAVLGYVIDPKTKEKKKVKFTKSNSIAVCRLRTAAPICCELFENFPQLGRFSLRDEGKTIAIGKIIGFPKDKDKK